MITLEYNVEFRPKRIRVNGTRDPLGEFVLLPEDGLGPSGYYFVAGSRAILPNRLREIADKLDELNQILVGEKIRISE